MNEGKLGSRSRHSTTTPQILAPSAPTWRQSPSVSQHTVMVHRSLPDCHAAEGAVSRLSELTPRQCEASAATPRTSVAPQSRTGSGPRGGTAHFARLKARRYLLRRRADDSGPCSSGVTGRAARFWCAPRTDGRFVLFPISGICRSSAQGRCSFFVTPLPDR